MKETWECVYAHKLFQVVVNMGRIVSVSGDAPKWAKGMRIRHFKRTVWKAFGDVERKPDEIRSIEGSPQVAAPCAESPEKDQATEESIEDAGGGSLECAVGPEPHLVPEVPEPNRRKEAVPRVRLGEQRVSAGTSLKDALKLARSLGCRVHTVRKSGEIRVAHPNINRRINANNRKKDAPKKLITFLNQLQASLPS
jgi:hypothetical protein